VNHEGGHAVLALEDSADTRQLWPHAFALEFAVTIGGSRLDMELRVRNTGESEFRFMTALHTYFAVSNARSARLEGIPGIDLSDPIDQVFPDAPKKTRLIDGAHTVAITQRGFRDSVVWSPSAERCASQTDMEPDDYLRMVCVEAATVEVPVVLAAGATWSGGQELTAS
jgi:glucose-6-phosphate 1-epimerase